MFPPAYPRPLRPKEEDLIGSVLPADRPGYLRVRRDFARMMVLAEGRRGPGNLVLGFPPDVPDLNSPLPPVIAFGMVETTMDEFSITVREPTETQMDIEIVSRRGEEIPDHFEEKRRWTYSTWLPGSASPATGASVREILIEEGITLAVAPAEKRLWLHDRTSGIVHVIPVTNFYNELMLHLHIRDPKIALQSSSLFYDPGRYADGDLRSAFIVYNATRHRVDVHTQLARPHENLIETLFEKLGVRRKKP